ncbi:MAG: LacI family DNA-binding transcriptional regulator [Candidatus Carbobacillus altaicus]|nr:LacI family DNA-binding transcriptional regulator [Candidatus Carbobacillus altaicus]
MAVTIKEIAERAGVSPSTVSRALAGNPRISAETRARIQRIIDELGYHPNMNARSLVVKSSGTIGVVLPRSGDSAFLNPFFPEVLRGITAALEEHGYALLLATGRDDAVKHEHVARMVQGKQVDGVILLESRADDHLIFYLREQRVPMVMIGRPLLEGIAYVDNDNVLAGKEATEYLLERGHRHIAFLGGSLAYAVTVDRRNGYMLAMDKAGIAPAMRTVLSTDFSEEDAYREVTDVLRRPDRPTAFVVADDLMALGVIGAVQSAGLTIPEDVSIVSFNNVLLSRLTNPPLTSVDIHILDLGRKAVEMLFALIEKSSSRVDHYTDTYIVHTQLIERGSVSLGPYASGNV